MKKIGIQGYAGSYHEQVALKHYGNIIEIVCYRQFPDMLRSLRSGEIDEAVMAIANNRYGFITEPYALLMEDEGSTLQIIGENTIQIKHYLLGIEGSKLEDITEIHSQSYAIGQCRKFIESTYPNAVIVEQDDTALAAKFVREKNDHRTACIASASAGIKYGLKTLKPGIQDDSNNMTRFLILSKRNESIVDKSNKSSILMQTSNKMGSLSDCLDEFKKLEINISLLHSSFVTNSDFTMRFWLEFDAGWLDARTRKVIHLLENEHNAKVQLLGSYLKNSGE